MESIRTSTFARLRFFVAAFSCLLVLSACGTAFNTKPLVIPDQLQDVQTRVKDDVTVSVAILTDEQARVHFGTDLKSADLQALWLSIQNASENTLWLIHNAIDRDLYSADEVAMVFKNQVKSSDIEMAEENFRNEAMRIKLDPQSHTEGFIYLPRAIGGRFVDVRLLSDTSDQTQPVKTATELRFGFAVPLPDGHFDYEKLNPSFTYPDRSLPDLDLNELRVELEQLPCCVTNADGDEFGDPINVVLIADSGKLLTSLTRSGWSFTHRITPGTVGHMIGAAVKGEAYPVAPVSSLYVYDRKQDFALQRARYSISQRNHIRFWLAPFTHQGEQVWLGQISRDIGIKLSTKSPSLTTHIIDPQVDLTREYLLHGLLAEGFVKKFGFVKGSRYATIDDPARNLTGDPYFSDGMRLVLFLPQEPLPLVDALQLNWENSAAPVTEGQTRQSDKNVHSVESDSR